LVEDQALNGYEILRQFNANIQQDDINGLLGAQSVKTHPQAENIMVIGSDSRDGLNPRTGPAWSPNGIAGHLAGPRTVNLLRFGTQASPQDPSLSIGHTLRCSDPRHLVRMIFVR
jgi:hypothetical protein